MNAGRTARAVDIFTVLVALSVIVALGAFVWHVVGLLAEDGPASGTGVATPQNGDVGPALALAPFGPADSRFAPPTSLALQLRGVILAVPRERSTALIAATGGIPVAYSIGQAVPGGAVEDIAIDRVLLRVNGRIERLDLPRVSTATAAPLPPGVGLSPPPGAMAPPSPGQSAPMGPPPRPIASLFENIPATPAASGYRVGAPLSPNAAQAGLQSGDIIEKVNGVPVNGLTADRTQLASLMASGYAQISVLRDKRRLSLSFPLR